MKNDYTKVIDKIKELRLERNLSQEALSLLCDIDRSYYGRLETQYKNLTMETFGKICDALNISWSEFFKDFK